MPRPVRGLFAFFDPLLGGAALVVEAHHRAAWQAHVRDDEANAGKQLTEMMLDLGHDAPRFGLTLRLIAKTLVAHQGLAGGSK